MLLINDTDNPSQDVMVTVISQRQQIEKSVPQGTTVRADLNPGACEVFAVSTSPAKEGNVTTVGDATVTITDDPQDASKLDLKIS